jgi:DNA primase
MSHEIETYATKRGFTPEEFVRYGVREDGDRIIIPTLGRKGAWYERIHRPNGNPKYEGPKGASSHLYNPLGLGPGAEEVWIAEGEFDCLSLVVVGIPAVGVLGAGNFNRHWALLFEGAEIVIAFDPDEAGNTQAEKLAQLWPEGQVSRFSPLPYDDLNDWFKADREGFKEAVLAW